MANGQRIGQSDWQLSFFSGVQEESRPRHRSALYTISSLRIAFLCNDRKKRDTHTQKRPQIKSYPLCAIAFLCVTTSNVTTLPHSNGTEEARGLTAIGLIIRWKEEHITFENVYGSLSCRRRRRRADVDARIYLFRDNRIEDKTIHVMRLVSIIISVMHRRGITSARRLLDQEGAERRRSAFDHHADAASFRVVIHRLRYSRPRFHVIMTHQRSRVIEPEDAPTTTTTGAAIEWEAALSFSRHSLSLCRYRVRNCCFYDGSGAAKEANKKPSIRTHSVEL